MDSPRGSTSFTCWEGRVLTSKMPSTWELAGAIFGENVEPVALFSRPWLDHPRANGISLSLCGKVPPPPCYYFLWSAS